jgi:hypothetical protein
MQMHMLKGELLWRCLTGRKAWARAFRRSTTSMDPPTRSHFILKN